MPNLRQKGLSKNARLNLAMVYRFAEWMSKQEFTERTRTRYLTVALQLCDYLKTKPFRAVSPIVIGDFLAEHVRPVSYHGFRNALIALRCFFRFLYLGGVVDTIAPAFIRNRAPVNKTPRVLTEQQVATVISATDNPRDRALVELLYATGCRPGEIAALKVSDVDFWHRRIHVCGKRKERYVYFGVPASKALHKYLDGRTSGALFLDAYTEQRGYLASDCLGAWQGRWTEWPTGIPRAKYLGKAMLSRKEAQRKFTAFLKGRSLERPRQPLGREGILQALRRTGERVGLPGLNARMLRHSFASHMLERGASIYTIKELLGHTLLSTTQVYTRISNRRVVDEFRHSHPRAA